MWHQKGGTTAVAGETDKIKSVFETLKFVEKNIQLTKEYVASNSLRHHAKSRFFSTIFKFVPNNGIQTCNFQCNQ